MTLTDTIIAATLVLLVISGVRQGSLRSLIGPASCISAWILAGIFYLITRSTPVAVLLIIAGPLTVSWLINLWLEINPGNATPQELSPASRIGGAAINAIWGAGVLLLLIILAVIIPLSSFGLGDIADNILGSRTYHALQQPLSRIGIITPSEVRDCLSDTCGTAERMTTSLARDQETRDLVDSPAFQALLKDPAVISAMQRNDVKALLAHPAVIRLKKDPDFVSKLLRLYPRIRPGQHR